MAMADSGHLATPESSRDPEDVFPLRDDFCDCCGQRRWFVMTMDHVQLGYAIRRNGEKKGRTTRVTNFESLTRPSPYLALGRLRARIQRALAMRRLEERAPGDFLPLRGTLEGRISYSGCRKTRSPLSSTASY